MGRPKKGQKGYVARKRGYGSVVDWGLGLNLLNQFGVFEAAGQLVSGNYTAAGQTLATRAINLNTYLYGVIPVVVWAKVKKHVPRTYMGPIRLT